MLYLHFVTMKYMDLNGYRYSEKTDKNQKKLQVDFFVHFEFIFLVRISQSGL